MTNPQVEVLDKIEDDDAILNYTHGKRKQIVEAMFKDGQPPKDDPKMMSMALMALDGMDRAALGKKRIKADEAIGNNQAQAAALIAQVLQGTATARPYESATPVNRSVPELSSDIPHPVLVNGETSTSAIQQSYETFVVPSHDGSTNQ